MTIAGTDTADLDDDALDAAAHLSMAHTGGTKPDVFADGFRACGRMYAPRIEEVIALHCGGAVFREVAVVLRDLAADMREASVPC